MPGSDRTTVLFAVLELQPAEFDALICTLPRAGRADIPAGGQFRIGVEFRH